MNVVILDTGCANLASVAYAVKRLGYDPVVSRDTNTILQADKVFLPGVGTASAAMEKLTERELVPLIKALTQPVLGICLGMQLLGSFSEEGQSTVPLLGLIDSPVQKMDANGLPVPHSGWNQVKALAGNPLFRDIPDNAYFYFVHSYSMPISSHTIAQTQYGNPFSSAVNCDNFYGVQFHPERSGTAGSRLIQNFLEM
ncbi:imidazole glycerol phosphate synthase subunit HisH [Providencia huaxiensis]|uniref:Imidazole glycerol phosphate synthase subunit HisH n=1 Tax=Providencia huaxiensis TaxID=2027290 RepID=A0A345LVZ5_9GAMM|nr:MULTISPECIES: imidazole glycerol phosphate synthase subunit HisH [Providencia]AXH62285.1 imidazole glycerol phosphate synthase subunit HisH [Providencia huaxiensis]MBN6361994.1 imidazole glycerol phosphate synthase subunit HisH [Providencia huaxiensis]MBQ0268439.1 imidazole glycerol phosphate synthase subunit HisH [Providencia huaxiensis]MBQ0533194.1 imidazole glycerol phosphate synthase subunit HisH [Providencia huaxiensis]MBQ0588396.1 imidazole glycerol phosphate synthase subunit HisH [Pr